MIIETNTWYDKSIKPMSVYNLQLLLSDGVETCPGYYYNHRFYIEDIDVTNEIVQWCILEQGEEPHLN